jgi:hypothetical protein
LGFGCGVWGKRKGLSLTRAKLGNCTSIYIVFGYCGAEQRCIKLNPLKD